jgi:hypothetical protein
MEGKENDLKRHAFRRTALIASLHSCALVTGVTKAHNQNKKNKKQSRTEEMFVVIIL